MTLFITPVTAEHWDALENLFGRGGASNGCWCMYWRIGPRYRERPREQNRRDLQRLATGERPPGLIAFDDGLPVGWCELAPRADLAWLARARYLAPIDDMPVWSVPCFYVRRTHRGPALEAYPIDTSVPGHTRNLFPGVASTFASCGFHVEAARRPDRPIMRRYLGGRCGWRA